MNDLDHHRVNCQFVGERVRVVKDTNFQRGFSVEGEEGEVVGYCPSNGDRPVIVDLFVPEGYVQLWTRPDMLRIVED